MEWMLALCSGYTSTYQVRQLGTAIIVIIDAGLAFRCIKELADIQSADDSEVPAVKKRIKNYIKAGVILTCLPALVDIIAGYYQK